MYTNVVNLNAGNAKELRRECGLWLRGLRETRGLSQRDVAAQVGGVFNTYVSQVETGAARISPERYREWSEVLGVDLRTFAKELMRYYDPITHRLLFYDELQSLDKADDAGPATR